MTRFSNLAKEALQLVSSLLLGMASYLPGRCDSSGVVLKPVGSSL